MTKDFANKKRRKKVKINQSILLFIGFAILISGLSFIIYKYGNSYQRPQVSSYVARISAWIESHKRHVNKINNHISLLKAEKNQNINNSPIHFEFYSALPNMQVVLSEPKFSERKMVTARQKPIGNVEDLERELSMHIKEKHHQLSSDPKESNKK